MAEQYLFRSKFGFNAKDLDPKLVHEALEDLRSTGPITPERQVEQARTDERTHPGYEWDDGKAAHEHRINQARCMARAVYIIKEPDRPATPAYVHVVDTGEGRYEPIEAVVRSIDLFESARDQLVRELKAAERSLRELEQASQMERNAERARRAARIRNPLEAAIKAAQDE